MCSSDLTVQFDKDYDTELVTHISELAYAKQFLSGGSVMMTPPPNSESHEALGSADKGPEPSPGP